MRVRLEARLIAKTRYAIRVALEGAAVVGVMDRAVSYGLGGPLYHEVRSARFGASGPMLNFIYGLGGRDLSLDDAKDVLRTLAEAKGAESVDEPVRYVALRE